VSGATIRRAADLSSRRVSKRAGSSKDVDPAFDRIANCGDELHGLRRGPEALSETPLLQLFPPAGPFGYRAVQQKRPPMMNCGIRLVTCSRLLTGRENDSGPAVGAHRYVPHRERDLGGTAIGPKLRK